MIIIIGGRDADSLPGVLGRSGSPSLSAVRASSRSEMSSGCWWCLLAACAARDSARALSASPCQSTLSMEIAHRAAADGHTHQKAAAAAAAAQQLPNCCFSLYTLPGPICQLLWGMKIAQVKLYLTTQGHSYSRKLHSV